VCDADGVVTVDGVGGIKTGINFANGGTTYGQIYFDNSGYGYYVWTIQNRVGINNTNPAYDLDVTGSVNLTGQFLVDASAGTAGQVLTSGGPSAAPAWADPAGTPAGTVIWFAANSAPTGYLAANGASVSTSTYAALFAVIGYTYGGAGAAFNLPDLRGTFIRGVDNSRGVDPSRVFGSTQLDAFQGHIHGWRRFPANGGGSGNTPLAQAGGTILNTIVTGPDTDGVNGTPRTASETRPRNIALLGCIKF
jgi:microcystin-dependent protein